MTTNAMTMTARRALRWLALPALALGCYVAVSVSQVSPPSIPAISLSSEPLYAKGTRDKPTLTLALSVEFPTVGAQYVDQPGTNEDGSYSPATEYVGYFDADSCYSYVNDADPARRRFDRIGVATSRACGGTGFSGNFMNWATSSAIDVLRLGLTGGDRIIDESGMTVLQRAVLPQGKFYNDTNFPAKKLLATLAPGAVPDALRRVGAANAYSGDIYVANCLNRIHFGTTKEGNCNAPGANSNLGVPDGTQLPSSGVFSGSLPADFVTVGSESYPGPGPGYSVSGTKQVAYGSGTTWAVITTSSTFYCANNWFAAQNVPNLASSGDPTPGVAKTCLTRTPPVVSGATALTSDYFFYSRVKVCEADASGNLLDPRRALCLRYPSGGYKPVGNLQLYSDRMRVAAFGYIMDSQQSRYGGVLRAPMKYVGPKQFDGTGSLLADSNTAVEWDTNSGIFRANPDTAGEGNSGVINYLNKFGRAVPASPGNYKTYDPVGELYYESLRYLQGLPPTPQATDGMTDAMKDGFPVYTSWTDPHAGGSRDRNYSCQKNNIFVIGDINTHNDKSIPGNTTRLDDYEFARPADVAANEPDFTYWTGIVGGFENRSTLATANTGATKASYYMAGMAYWALTHDIRGTDWTAAGGPDKQRPGMRVKTFVLDVNEYGNSSNASTRRNSAFFLTAKYGGFDTDKAQSGTNPLKNTSGATDPSVWQKSTDPGEARTFFLASNAKAVLASLNQIFETVASEGNSIAGGAISTQRLTSVGGYIYQAQFKPEDWSGDVVAYTVAVDAANQVTIGTESTAAWKASTQLDNATLPADRKIFVGKTTADSSSAATAFTWDGIEASLKTALNKPSPSGNADDLGQQRLAFLRGDRSLEGSTFRKRGSRLGDVINSAIVYSGAPTRSFSSDAFRTYYDNNKDRAKALFVGANDGMLHAFDATTGNELFAYIPSWLGPKLSQLTGTTYIGAHQSYVDGSPAVAEAQVGSEVKTVLVGGTGAGGQGLYALDVTDPANFDASKVMWEFTDRDDPAMGNVVGRPQILRLRTSGPGASATYKWFAVVASGVNNYVNDGYFSSSGAPALFLLDLAKPKGDAWSLGNNYYKVVFPVDASIAATRPTGMINFTATGGPSEGVGQIYAGDLHGRMWKLDFTKAAASAWSLASLSSFGVDANTPLPMYVARDASNAVQPITMPPTPLFGPSNSTLLAFGTGKYMEPTDNTVDGSTQTQSVYVLFDNTSSTLDNNPNGGAAISGRARLQAGAISGTAVSVPAFLWGRAMSDNDNTQRSGWYVDLPGGERLISAFGVFGNTIVFGSVIPPDGMGTGACGAGGGNLYSVNVATGTGVTKPSSIGVLGEPFIFQVAASTTLGDSLGRRTRTVTGQIVLQGSTGLQVVQEQPTNSYTVGRLSWRQIPNYQELRSH